MGKRLHLEVICPILISLEYLLGSRPSLIPHPPPPALPHVNAILCRERCIHATEKGSLGSHFESSDAKDGRVSHNVARCLYHQLLRLPSSRS